MLIDTLILTNDMECKQFLFGLHKSCSENTLGNKSAWKCTYLDVIHIHNSECKQRAPK